MRSLTLLLLVPLMGFAPSQGDAKPLSRSEMERYQDMLTLLSDAPGDPWSSPEPVAVDPDSTSLQRALRVAASVVEILAATDSLSGDDAVLPALSLARSFHHLGLQERAREWYQRADSLDADGHMSDLLQLESLKRAETGDSTAVALALSHGVQVDPRRHEGLLAELLDIALSWGLESEALPVAERLAGRKQLAPPTLINMARLWEATGDRQRALSDYRRALISHRELTSAQQAHLAASVADLHFARGDRQEARRLYTTIQKHDVGLLAAWSTYQLGVLASLRADHRDARDQFRSLCEREYKTPWQDAACWQMDQSAALLDLQVELRARKGAARGRRR